MGIAQLTSVLRRREATHGQLRKLRKAVTKALLDAGFAFDPENPEHRTTKHEGRYTIYQLPYAPVTEGMGALRPEIQIDTAVFPLRRASITRPVTSFIAEGRGQPAEGAAIECASIPETAAEKFVALTRRAGAELAGLRDKRDPTLVRHIYDLHVTREQYDAADVAALAREIMVADAALRGRDFPAYQADPLAETLKAVEGIAADAEFRTAYATFSRDMVYGDVPNFDTTLATLTTLAQHLEGKPEPHERTADRARAAAIDGGAAGRPAGRGHAPTVQDR